MSTTGCAYALWGNLKCVSPILKNLVRYTVLVRASAFLVRLSALTFQYIAQAVRASVFPVRLSAFPVRLCALTFQYIAQAVRLSAFPVRASALT